MTARDLLQRIDAAMLSLCIGLATATLAIIVLTVAHHYRAPAGCVVIGNAILMGCP